MKRDEVSDRKEPDWSKAADVVSGAFKTVDERDIVQVIMSGLERYSIAVHGSSESSMRPILTELKRASGDRIHSI